MTHEPETLKAVVREKYGDIAERRVKSCCGPDCCSSEAYDVSEDVTHLEGYVSEADLGLGCGVPTEHAGIQPGETVLDLGSGAGIDVFIARSLVGEGGHVIGVDMTEPMIRKARQNARQLGFENVEFRLGEIEDLPVAADTVDLVISNCVLNLVPDKEKAFAEIFRVLKPGGRFCISDIVSAGYLPPSLRAAAELYAGCVAGALDRSDYLGIITGTGFEEVRVVAERETPIPESVLGEHDLNNDLGAFRAGGGRLFSVTVTGRKATTSSNPAR
jgi:arsenite methyltransferase